MADVTPLNLDPKYDDYDFPTISPSKLPGHPGHVSPQQEAQVHQLRMKLEQQGFTERLDTITLLRFLRARKFDVALAEKMFLDSEKWRKEFNLDELVRSFDYPEKAKVFEYYPQYYHKTDIDGRPLYIEQLGKIDLPSMHTFTTEDRMLQNLAVEYEKLSDPRLPACSRKAGHLVETCCSVLDLKGVGISKATKAYSYIQRASAISQNYYPERLGKLYIINAPWGFSGIFSFIKGWLDPVTVEKIHILGSGYEKELLKQIPKENLPKGFGGSCDCPGGCMLSDVGPWTEPEYTREPKWAQKAKSAAAAPAQAPTATEPAAPAPAAAPTAAPLAAAPAASVPEKEITLQQFTQDEIKPAPAQQ